MSTRQKKRALKSKKVKSIFKFLLKLFFLPMHLFIYKTIKVKDKLRIKILKTLGIIIFVTPFSLIINAIIIIIFLTIFYYAGIIRSPTQIIGRSMLPSLEEGQLLFMHPFNNWMFWNTKINRGDLVIFRAPNDPGKDYVKRVIGLPNDEIEIRNGFVYINGKTIDEPYVNKFRSTYGGIFLSECRKMKVPVDTVFTLGDNRTGSKDSREIGPISIKDIHSILYYGEQKHASATEDDINLDAVMLNIDDYVKLVNKLRENNNLKPLVLSQKLSKSAEYRANAMLKFDDLSWTATISGYPMSRSTADAGYYNIVYGEYPITGYYDADELYNYVTEVSKSSDFLLNKDYQDIGVAAVIGDLNNCPVQLVVQQMAGYVPPNYSQSNIDSWEKSLSGLRGVQSGWLSLKNNNYMYQKYRSDVDSINNLISIRVTNLENLVSKMKSNQWATSEMNKDKSLFDQIEALATKLNSSK